MTLFKTIILGLLQGLTEFLPVSSSGHLSLARAFFDITQNAMAIDVAFHFGTLFSILFYYRKILHENIKNFSLKQTISNPFLFQILIGIIPAAIAGFFWMDFFEKFFTNLVIVCIFLMITGCILFSSKYSKDQTQSLSYLKAFIIGMAQILSLFPGISRAGTTISIGIHSGLSRKQAADFSFFMAIPLLFGAGLLKIPVLFNLPFDVLIYIFLGMLISFLSGIVAIHLVIKTLTHHKFHHFAWYCWTAAIAGLLYF